MLDRHSHYAYQTMTAPPGIKEQPLLPATLASGYLPGFALSALGVEQAPALGPAHNKGYFLLQQQSQPGTARKAPVEDMPQARSPGGHTLPEQALLDGAGLCSLRAPCAKPAHAGPMRPTLPATDQQAQPAQAGHEDGLSAFRRVVVARFDAGEALALAASYRAQPLGSQALGLLLHPLLPQQQRLFPRRLQLLQMVGGLLPEKGREHSCCPLLGAEEVRKALGAGGGALRGKQKAAQLR